VSLVNRRRGGVFVSVKTLAFDSSKMMHDWINIGRRQYFKNDGYRDQTLNIPPGYKSVFVCNWARVQKVRESPMK